MRRGGAETAVVAFDGRDAALIVVGAGLLVGARSGRSRGPIVLGQDDARFMAWWGLDTYFRDWRMLVDEARAWNADCVFLGAKGHGRIKRMIIGSVSAAVAARAHCSVEVVRAS